MAAVDSRARRSISVRANELTLSFRGPRWRIATIPGVVSWGEGFAALLVKMWMRGRKDRLSQPLRPRPLDDFGVWVERVASCRRHPPPLLAVAFICAVAVGCGTDGKTSPGPVKLTLI